MNYAHKGHICRPKDISSVDCHNERYQVLPIMIAGPTPKSDMRPVASGRPKICLEKTVEM